MSCTLLAGVDLGVLYKTEARNCIRAVLKGSEGRFSSQSPNSLKFKNTGKVKHY